MKINDTSTGSAGRSISTETEGKTEGAERATNRVTEAVTSIVSRMPTPYSRTAASRSFDTNGSFWQASNTNVSASNLIGIHIHERKHDHGGISRTSSLTSIPSMLAPSPLTRRASDYTHYSLDSTDDYITTFDNPTDVPLVEGTENVINTGNREFDSRIGSDILIGEEAIKETGIWSGHIEGLQDEANESDEGFGFRPVNKLSTGLIAEDHPTKDLQCKAKSAKSGPAAGMIEVGQRHAGHRTPYRLHKFKQEAVKTIGNDEAKPVQCRLSQERLKSLLNPDDLGKELETPLNLVEGKIDDDRIVLNSLDRKGINNTTECEYTAFKQPDGHYLVFDTRLDQPDASKAYTVLDHIDSPEPLGLTADYDLCVIFVRVEQYGPADNVRSQPHPRSSTSRSSRGSFALRSTSGDSSVSSSIAGASSDDNESGIRSRRSSVESRVSSRVDSLRRSSLISDLSQSHPDEGNVSVRVQGLKDRINERLGCVGEKELLKVVHHGTDAENPATVHDDNYPMTIFVPNTIPEIGGKPIVVKTKRAFAALVRVVRDAGFVVELSKKWDGLDPSLTRSSRFEHARRVFSGKPNRSDRSGDA